MSNKTVAGQIRRLLFILGTGVLAALIVSATFLWRYDYANTYMLKDILLSPETIEVLRERSQQPKKGSFPRFLFSNLQLRYYDTDVKQWKEEPLAMEQYQRLYDSIENDKSMGAPSEDVQNQFRTGYAATLAIMTHSEKDSASYPFQQIQFSSLGDYYRVELRLENRDKTPWVYYKHPAIFEKLIAIVNNSSSIEP